MADGYLGKCKDCTKEDVRLREKVLSKDEEWAEKEKNRHREKYHRLEYREKHKPSYESKKKAMDKYKEKYPEKVKAKNLSQHKFREKGNHLHHWSYNEKDAKSCIELSELNHNKIHRFLVYDTEHKMYRTKSGDLLDSKESHEQYINYIIENDK